MYRISTFMMHDLAGQSIQRRSAELSKIQNQISSGKRINQPSDDPVAAVKLLDLQKQQSESEQYAKNISAAINRSNLEETALSDLDNILQRVRSLVVQGANTGGLADSDRMSIRNELQSLSGQLMDVVNRKDSNGEYLFSGFSSSIQPFARNGAGVVQYQGDAGTRLIKVGPSQWIGDGHEGADAFVNIAQGNGVFYTGATASNTGTGVINVGSITDRTQWTPDDYTLTFTSATNWQITDSSSAVITSGTYTAGSPISFNGVQVSVTGTPATGDSFSINQSGTEDVFRTLDNLVAALGQSSSVSVSRARIDTALAGGLQQLDQSLDHLLSIRSQIGTRLNALETAESSRQTNNDEVAKSISQLQDLDYSTALTKYSAQQVVLQAAQQSYTQIAKLSLFNYL